MGFDLDEMFYGRVVKFLKSKRKKSEAQDPLRVHLDEIKPRLTLVARALTGKAIDIYPAEREGGYKNNNFFLPISFAEFPHLKSNVNFYLFRVLYLSVQQELNLNFSEGDNDLQLAREEAQKASSKVLTVLEKNYPAAYVIYKEALSHFESKATPKLPADYTWLYGKFMINSQVGEEELLEHFDDAVKAKNDQPRPETIKKANAVEEIKSVTVDKKQQEDYVLLHNFEKVETAEEFSGSWRDFDGKDDLEEHQNALDELSMRNTVRVDDTAHSVYQADFVENTSVRESAQNDDKGLFLTYDEWDYKKRKYRPDFCRVYPKTQLKTDADYYTATIRKNISTLTGLRKMLTSINNKMQQQRRQIDGPDLDIDALIDLFVDVKSKRSPSEKVFLSSQKKDKDLSILLLLDLSLSSDGYAANSRVIDVEKEVSILFGEILNEFNVDFSVDGFYSKTRNFSTYITLKEFEENWSQARNKIGAAEPSGYTRIGAALRHAGARMALRPTKNKWIILLSDGKPNDYDRYEGQHGIHDVKQALRELNQNHVNTYALAIEAQAKYYLPQMFGHNHYQILTTPTELLQSLVKLYEKIKHQ